MIQYIDAALIKCPCVVADRHLMLRIKLYGLQPLVVRRVDDNYYILDGVKRYNAALLLGHSVLPCIIKVCTDGEAYEFLKLNEIIRLVLAKKTVDDWSI